MRSLCISNWRFLNVLKCFGNLRNGVKIVIYNSGKASLAWSIYG